MRSQRSRSDGNDELIAMYQVTTPIARDFGFNSVPPCHALRIDGGDFVRHQGNHDRKAGLHYKEYVIYP